MRGGNLQEQLEKIYIALDVLPPDIVNVVVAHLIDNQANESYERVIRRVMNIGQVPVTHTEQAGQRHRTRSDGARQQLTPEEKRKKCQAMYTTQECKNECCDDQGNSISTPLCDFHCS